MWFGVLGTLEVRDEAGAAIPVGGPMRRSLLAALLCRAGQVVPAEELIDNLWPAPPRSAAKTLQSHVVRLRDDLGRDREVISSSRIGYGITLARHELDAGAFELALRDGLAAAAHGDPSAAVAVLDESLAWWRDAAYLEFGEAPFAVAERIRLSELRALALETRTDAALDLGQTAMLVSELERRIAAEPYRERSWEQLILALYRSGRQAEALSTYRAARDQLAADLGVDPGPSLQSLHERVLRQDPTLLAPSLLAPTLRPAQVTSSLAPNGLALNGDAPTAVPPTAAALTAAAQCPWRGLDGYQEGDAALFVGRETVCAQVLGRLAEPGAVVLTGASGSGKSSLIRAAVLPSLRRGAVPGSAAWPVTVTVPSAPWPQHPGAVVIVDQAEEMFSVLDQDGRRRFVASLASYVENDGRLLLALRGDFFTRLADEPWLAKVGRHAPVLIGPMQEQALRRVVTEPARQVGLLVAAEVVDAVVDDAVGQAQPLPMISLALVRAWQQSAGAAITPAAYRGGGGVAGAIESTAESVYAGLDANGQRAARRFLVRMATREGSSWVRHPVPRSAVTDQDSAAVVGAFIDGRLVTAVQDRLELSHDALLEHWPRLRGWLDERVSAADDLEHLATAARAWRAAGRSETDLYRGPRLQNALRWRSEHPEDVAGDEAAFLDASERADEAELSRAQRRIVVERRGRLRLRWVAGGLAATLVLALVGALLAVTARSSATRSARRARASALSADARRLAAESLSAPDIATSALLAAAAYRLQDSPDTRGAMLSALERGQSALFRVATPRRLVGLVASADGRKLFALQNDRTVDVVDVASRRVVSSYAARASDVIGVSGAALVVAGPVSGPSVTHLGQLAVRNAATGATEHVLTGAVMDGPAVPSIAPAGRWLVADRATDPSAQHPSPTLVVYDSHNWSRPPRTMRLPAPVLEIAAGDRVAVVTTTAHRIYLIDLATLRVKAAATRTDLPDETSASQNVPFTVSENGRAVSYARDESDAAPVLLSTADLAGAGTTLPRTGIAALKLRFNPGGTQLAVGYDSGALAVYRVADGTPAASLAGQSGSILGLAWAATSAQTSPAQTPPAQTSPAQTPPAQTTRGAGVRSTVASNGNPALYSAGLDSQVVSWDVSPTPRLLQLRGPVIPTADFAVQAGTNVFGVYPSQGSVPTAQERMFAFALSSGTVRSWVLGLHASDYVSQVAPTPDGTRALVSIEGARGSRWQVWDLRRGLVVRTIAAPPGADSHAGLSGAISPDGRTAVIGIDATRLGVVDLVSGRLTRTIRVHFAGAGGSRISAVPWQFTPHGRLQLWGYDPGPPAPTGTATPTVADQRLGLLDVARGVLVAQTSVGDIDGPKFFGWSHDGATMVMGTYAGSLATFAADSLRPIAQASAVDTGYVLTASFSPDDRTIVAAGTDATMSFWTASNLSREGGREVAPSVSSSWWFAWFDPRGDVTGLAPQTDRPTADGLRLFTFPARTTDWLSLICSLAGPMTRGQWAHYVGDQPYRSVC